MQQESFLRKNRALAGAALCLRRGAALYAVFITKKKSSCFHKVHHDTLFKNVQSHVSLGAAAIGDRLLRGRKDHVEERHHEYLPDLEAAEKAQLPGKLKIFFGYAAGVGKTYAFP